MRGEIMVYQKDDIEQLKIYHEYLLFIMYVEDILKKFPRDNIYSIGNQIANSTYQGLYKIILGNRTFSNTERLSILSQLDSDLKYLKALIRVSYKKKYITSKNMAAWSRKITNISVLLGGWIKSCQKH